MTSENAYFIGRCTDHGKPVAFAVEAETHDELTRWLWSELCLDDEGLRSVDISGHTSKENAIAFLRAAPKEVWAVGSFPEALAIEEERAEASWDAFFDALASSPDPNALAEWVRFQRSLRDPRDRMWVVKCVLIGERRVASVQVERNSGLAIASASDAVQRWVDPNGHIKSFLTLDAGKLNSPETDRLALEWLREAREQGYELLGALQVIGARELLEASDPNKPAHT